MFVQLGAAANFDDLVNLAIVTKLGDPKCL